MRAIMQMVAGLVTLLFRPSRQKPKSGQGKKWRAKRRRVPPDGLVQWIR